MPAIGQGVLPDPNTVDATVYDAWLVISTDPEVKDKYYELIGSPPDQDWLLSSANIIESSDPIINDDGSVVRFDEFLLAKIEPDPLIGLESDTVDEAIDELAEDIYDINNMPSLALDYALQRNA